MGPLQQSKKMQERELARSRIPRLVLRPYLPKQKKSPSSESPFSEEESKYFHSRRSARTISSNSFCSDDTGCPSSQSVSPVKTPSDAGLSPMEFCTRSKEDFGRKRVGVGTFADKNVQPSRYKKEMKISLLKTGSEADFSSSSSTGSISAPEVHMKAMSGGKKASFSRKLPYRPEPQKRAARIASESRISHGKGNTPSSSKPGSSPPGARDKELFSVLCRNPVNPVNVHDPYGVSSASSSNSSSYKGSDTSPTPRRTLRYASCGDNHGVKPPSPEQYLTPLQQKEVSIRHLKAKLKESQTTLEDREAEIVDLKSQLARMREDWIEEECHRVEAQLALKEARKEIKQLKQFIETMKNSLVEKDKGIQKYFIDINIQNSKLETLLQSMELAQDCGFRDEPCMDYICNSPGASLTESAIYDKMSEGLLLEDQATEEMADCDLLLNDDLANRDDLFDEIMMETTSELDSLTTFGIFNEKPNSNRIQSSHWMEQAIQTDVVPYSLDFENTILKIFKANNEGRSNFLRGLHFTCSNGPTTLIDLTPDDPNSAILLSPDPLDKDIVLGDKESCATKELDFEGVPTEGSGQGTAQACVIDSHWSNHFFTDLLAVAVPIIPTVLWALNTQRGNPDPVYNIGAMMRGCCLLALHSLRKSYRTTRI
ncbi:syntabulin S homeolog [Xenopus laevis]|uniref:MGC86213 protein n=1 Tax=Xenopus laevis TaxID=8355 RepID=Q6AX48_XENLA|nr:syntabulin S homeolog [Xenopus laevis]AAH79762.1 MGC86213 protein [Xenopus laevis]